mmetsp:Transcript_21604/g.40985  ORF Transcript_21604/g.40985 Transcript_21604/m.40985 type:complete len:113 (+) Transcript_21604:44-382(+)
MSRMVDHIGFSFQRNLRNAAAESSDTAVGGIALIFLLLMLIMTVLLCRLPKGWVSCLDTRYTTRPGDDESQASMHGIEAILHVENELTRRKMAIGKCLRVEVSVFQVETRLL